MLFNSLSFLLFFPCVILIYYIIPQKLKNVWLLVSSYFFYMGWNAKYAMLLLGCTLVSYIGTILISKAEKKKELLLFSALFMIFGVLFVFKYLNFCVDNLERVLSIVNGNIVLPRSHWLLPVGISFYVFQTAGYLIDVYRDEKELEKNFIKYALFVSFFPQLVAGPIERSKNILKQFDTDRKFDYGKVKDGLFLMIWGYFLKMVIADRAALFVNSVYGEYEIIGEISADASGGAAILIATAFFALQIYCDFYGYSIIATGAAKMLGVDLMENFNAPYLSLTVKEFWQKWHISLTSWFRDYIYIPLGGSWCGRIRKYFNLLFVFFISGLWHGASWNYVIWGLLNGIYQCVGDATFNMRKKVRNALHINDETETYKIFRMLVTFILVDFSWLFFRANGINNAFVLIKQIFGNFALENVLSDAFYTHGLSRSNVNVLIFAVCILIFADYCKRKKIIIRQWIYRQNAVFQILFVVFAVLWIVSRGVWGRIYDVQNFIYFQF